MSDGPEMLTAGQSLEAGRVERALSWTFFGFVALCLVVPLVQTLYPVFGTIVPAVEERRTANPFPSLRLLLGTNGDFAAGVNKWFDDRVGFRDLFIRSKNQIDYTLFRTSKKIYIGSDGWLFYPPEPDDVAVIDAAGLSELEQSYITLAQWLHDRGVQLIVVGYPDKSAIYPEMAPPQMPQMAAGGNYDQFRHFLATRSELTFIDAEEIIKREKSKNPDILYAKTDMHATEIAQVLVVKEIIARIAQAEGRPDISWDEKFTLLHAQSSDGSEARFLSLLFQPEEEMPYFDGTYTIGGSEPDGHWFLPDPQVFESADDGVGRPFDWEFRSSPELCPQRLPGMVLFGNSFSDFYWTLGLHRYFCSIRRARAPLSRLKLFYETMPAGTKYFVYEYFEPWLMVDFRLLSDFPASR
jgi:hypothetical protein